MSSTFPTSFDSFTDPTATGKLNSPSHSQQHINVNDAIEKLEAKVGIDSSADTDSIDYKINNIVINRGFVWYLDGTSIVADEVGMKYIIPQDMTVIAIHHKTVSGTATIRIQQDTTDVDAGISVTSTAGKETAITTPALTEGKVLTLDITAATDCVGLSVHVETTQP